MTLGLANMVPGLIALEEHFMAKVVQKRTPDAGAPLEMFTKTMLENMVDLGERRVANMKEGGMSLQVISHNPGCLPPDVVREVNKEMYEAVQAYPNHFKALAALPVGHPGAIPAELERCVKEMGFLGALISNTAEGTFFDGKAYWPMFEKAQKLDVPIYLHPQPSAFLERWKGDYDFSAQKLIAGPALCWHTEVGDHILRLWASGVFDAFPRLKIILGHDGEILPFMMDRADKMFSRKWAACPNRRSFKTVWLENIWVTTAGMFDLGPLACCLRVCKPDHILYSKFLIFTSSCRVAFVVNVY